MLQLFFSYDIVRLLHLPWRRRLHKGRCGVCGDVNVFLLEDVSVLVLVSPAQGPPVREDATQAGSPEAEAQARGLGLVVIVAQGKSSHIDGGVVDNVVVGGCCTVDLYVIDTQQSMDNTEVWKIETLQTRGPQEYYLKLKPVSSPDGGEEISDARGVGRRLYFGILVGYGQARLWTCNVDRV